MTSPLVNPPPAPARLPARAQRLAWAGVLPFVAGAALVWLVRGDVLPDVALALSAYAALVASFLGGVHWGLAMRSTADDSTPATGFAWAVVPTIVGWPALLMPAGAGLALLGAVLAGCYMVDRRLYPRYGLAHWLTLRFRLSAVAALSCFIGAAGS